jgi:cytochrome b6-f complex iron-sulfur subunit
MPDDPRSGLFFPGQEAAAALDPTAEAAQAALARPRRRTIPRRLVIRWAAWGSLLAVLAGWGNGFLSFFQPGRVGAFGGVITAGSVGDFKLGDVKQVTEGKFWLTVVPEGFIALWWKCPHLGCTVPWRENDPAMSGDEFMDNGKGRFNCPCHGSIYNRYGQIIQGPAPRPMDRFPVRIEGDKIRVDTGPTKAIVREKAGPEGAVSA